MTMQASDDPRIARGMQTQLARRAELLRAGEQPLGWKLGFGAPAALEKLRLKMPITGFLLKRGLVPSGGMISLKGLVKPIAEPEIAVHMGKDLAGGADAKTVAAAIAGLGPAIEIADLDIAPEPDRIEAILAGNIFHRHVLLGPPDPARAGGKLAGLVSRALRNGAEVARTADPQGNIGQLLGIIGHLASQLAACGERLRAGEVVITGSVVPFFFLTAEDRSFAHELAPLGEVSVQLDHR